MSTALKGAGNDTGTVFGPQGPCGSPANWSRRRTNGRDFRAVTDRGRCDGSTEDLFEYPWLYATRTGYRGLSEEEPGRLREYLLRGDLLKLRGDLLKPWGDWSGDRQIEEIHGDGAVLHVVYSASTSTRSSTP